MGKSVLRMFLAMVLMAAMAVPAGELNALAQQQQEKKKQEPQGEVSITVDVPLVTVDVVVTDNRGNYVSGLRKENFRILEDNVPQPITNFAPTDAPITIVVLMEFSKLGFESFAYYGRQFAYDFMRHLKKEDWVALVSFDMKPRIEVDFTQNKAEVENHLARMYFPGFSESNIFDAVIDTVDRLDEVKGKKAILLMASGVDTFSKKTLDDTIKRLRSTDVTIYSIGVARPYWEYFDSRGAGGTFAITFIQGENQLTSMARMTGGRAWMPRFYGEMPDIFRDVVSALRNQYSLVFSPTNPKRDGKYRKIKVQLVNDKGEPLIVKDQNNKTVKYVVYAREGYNAPKGAVSD